MLSIYHTLASVGKPTLDLARTDAVATEGLAVTLDRAERYLECGVDALFIETLRTPALLVTGQAYSADSL